MAFLQVISILSRLFGTQSTALWKWVEMTHRLSERGKIGWQLYGGHCHPVFAIHPTLINLRPADPKLLR